jgi:hypothetical protein
MAPRIWKSIRPTAVEVSIPWSSTTRSGAVTVLGEPGELVLFAFGRDAVRVELQGERRVATVGLRTNTPPRAEMR